VRGEVQAGAVMLQAGFLRVRQHVSNHPTRPSHTLNLREISRGRSVNGIMMGMHAHSQAPATLLTHGSEPGTHPCTWVTRAHTHTRMHSRSHTDTHTHVHTEVPPQPHPPTRSLQPATHLQARVVHVHRTRHAAHAQLGAVRLPRERGDRVEVLHMLHARLQDRWGGVQGVAAGPGPFQAIKFLHAPCMCVLRARRIASKGVQGAAAGKLGC